MYLLVLQCDCFGYLITSYEKVTCSVDEGKAVGVGYLDFTEAFDTVSHSVLLEKLAAHGIALSAG